MAIKLTPERLRRLVLEEKAKMTAKMGKEGKKHDLDPKAKKEMYMEMDEDYPGKPPHAKKYTAGKKLETMKMMKEHEENLRNQLRRLQERRLALRRQIISDLE
jgi:hypothetical protein